jgi:hypothetical protein
MVRACFRRRRLGADELDVELTERASESVEPLREVLEGEVREQAELERDDTTGDGSLWRGAWVDRVPARGGRVVRALGLGCWASLELVETAYLPPPWKCKLGAGMGTGAGAGTRLCLNFRLRGPRWRSLGHTCRRAGRCSARTGEPRLCGRRPKADAGAGSGPGGVDARAGYSKLVGTTTRKFTSRSESGSGAGDNGGSGRRAPRPWSASITSL